MIDFVFNSFYSRLLIAAVISLMIVFVDKFEFLHNKIVTLLLFIMISLMIVSNMFQDYGLLLLIVALFILSYNMSIILPKNEEQK
uniref:Uncharacterized protein n=1 Tax=viral metagenome TaxID=1070528 RepID=A0A6C0BGS3_9ZZZZ